MYLPDVPQNNTNIMKKYLKRTLLLLAVVVCMPLITACGDDEPEDPSDKDKVYAQYNISGVLTEDLLYLADVQVIFKATNTDTRYYVVDNTKFQTSARYQIQLPMTCQLQVAVKATPKSDFNARVATKEYWNLWDTDSKITLVYKKTDYNGKLLQERYATETGEIKNHVPSDEVSLFLMQTDLFHAFDKVE